MAEKMQNGCTTPQMANFYEKALFVKPADVAAAVWCGRDCSALRAMLLSALSVSSLFGDSVHYGIRLFELKALQSSERSCLKGGPSSHRAVALLDPKRVRARSAMAIRQGFRVA
jgi:hypothetical protein